MHCFPYLIRTARAGSRDIETIALAAFSAVAATHQAIEKARSVLVSTPNKFTFVPSQEPTMPAAKAPKLTPEEQRQRFIDTAREAGTSNDPAVFDKAFKKVTTPDQTGVRIGIAEKPKPIN